MRIFRPAMWLRCPSLVHAAVVPVPYRTGTAVERAREFPPGPAVLLDDLRDPTGAYGPAAFADSEAQTFLHSDRLNEVDLHLGVVTGQHHLGAFRQVHHAGHVRGAEVELRPVVVEERRVAAAFVLGQDVDLRLELGVRGVGARLDDDLAALNVLALGTA